MKKEFLAFPRSAKLFLVSSFLLSGYYTWPFWYGYASGRITASQFGVYLAVVYIVGLVSEVPTGVFADRFGRKLSAFIGALLEGITPIIIYVGGNFTAYIIAAVVAGVGVAFVSGSLESLVHDLPSMTKDVYRKVMVQDTFFYQSGLVVSAALGGFMFSLNHLLPFATQAASFFLAAIIIMKMTSDGEIINEREVDSTATKRVRFGLFISELKEGFLHLFRVRTIQPLIVFGCTISVLMSMCIEYINEAGMIHYDIQPDSRGLLIAGAKLLALIFLSTITIKRFKTDKQKLYYLLFITVVVFSLYALGVKSLFLIGFLGFNLVSSTQSNFIRPILHDHIESRWRATAISAYSFVSNLFLAGASVIVGIMLQKQGVIFVQRSLLILFVVVGIPALLTYLPRAKLHESGLDAQV